MARTSLTFGSIALIILTLAAANAQVAHQAGPNLRGKSDATGEDGGPMAPSLPLAKANFQAWFTTKNLPVWKNEYGGVPMWKELGPGMLYNGWNGADNAGRMTCLAIDPTDDHVIYAGAASGGLWKSIDGGQDWKPMADQEPSLSYGAVTIDPRDPAIIYAGMGEPNNSLDSFQGAGLLRSLDHGNHWSLLSSRVFMGQRFSRILLSPEIPNEIFVATTRGVMRSIDAGGTWVQLLKGDATDLILNPQDPNQMMAALGNYRGDPANGLYSSQDGGETWTRLTTDLPYPGTKLGRLQFGQCAKYPNVVYAAMYSNGTGLDGLMKSEDFGVSWVRMPNAPSYAGGSAWYYNVVAVSPVNPNIVFLSGTTTYRSEDGGNTWLDNTESYGPGRVHPDHHAITFDPSQPASLFLCTDGGIFKSNNNGDSWTPVNHDLATVQFQFVDVHPTDPNIAYGGTQDNGTNKYLGNYFWTNVEAGDGGVTRVNPVHPDIVYGEYVNLALYKSTDSGKNWDWDIVKGIDKKEGTLFYAPFNLDPENPDILVTGTSRVYRTTDAATSWTPISPILGSRVSAVTIAPNNSKVIYAGTNDGRLWVTPDTGKRWFEITSGIPKQYVNDIEIDPRNARIVYVALNSWTYSSIWKSTDAGGTWTNISDDLPPLPAYTLVLNPNEPDQVFVATATGVFVSDYGDGNWLRYGPNLPNAPVFSIVANKVTGLLTVGTHGRGAWSAPLPK